MRHDYLQCDLLNGDQNELQGDGVHGSVYLGLGLAMTGPG